MNSMNRLISYRVLVEEDMPDHFEIIGIRTFCIAYPNGKLVHPSHGFQTMANSTCELETSLSALLP
jgi:hypothetical protein